VVATNGSFTPGLYDPTIGKFYVRCDTTGVGNKSAILKSVRFPFNIDVYYLLRSAGVNNIDGCGMKGGTDTYGNFDLLLTYEGTIQQQFIAFYGGASYSFGLVATAPNYVPNTWFCKRVRYAGSRMMSKVWPYGTAEPDWQINMYYPSKIPTTTWPRVTQGNFAIMQFAGLQFPKDTADLRITPIYKTGGGAP
jgi:hypothetical protein